MKLTISVDSFISILDKLAMLTNGRVGFGIRTYGFYLRAFVTIHTAFSAINFHVILNTVWRRINVTIK